MSKLNYYNKQISLPSFNKRFLLNAFLMIVLCNVVFLGLAFITKTARPIINADYFIVLILLYLPYKISRVLGFLVFAVVVFFDVIMFTMQMFPFMDLSGFIYFLPFIKIAPLIYQVLTFLAVLLILLLPYGLIKLSKKTNLYHLVLILIPLVMVGYFTQHFQYHKRDLQFEIFGANNFYYVNSQFFLYNFNKNHGFLSQVDISPSLISYEKEYASIHLKKSNKILFIVNESWGRFKNDNLHNDIIEELLKHQEKFEFIEQGSFPFQDATVNGELRELCQLQIKGFAFERMDDNALKKCLPNQLKQFNYKTVALHTASGGLYERYYWYPKAGFDKLIFSENLMAYKKCSVFRGVCDSEVIELIGDEFSKNDYLFFYWLTLTSHYPYRESDMQVHNRIDCQKYALENSSFCGNAKLQQQFFDNLSTLIDNPAMKGVEVMVVGDHIPPADSLLDAQKYLKDNGVSWVHFKIK